MIKSKWGKTSVVHLVQNQLVRKILIFLFFFFFEVLALPKLSS